MTKVPLQKLDELVFTWPIGILGGLGGLAYTAMVASPENPQGMKYVLGGHAVGSLVGLYLDYINNR